MVDRALARVAVLAAVMLVAAACDDPGEPAPSPPDGTVTTTTTPSPEAFDPRTVDLANAQWTFAVAGWEDGPVTVTLADGEARAQVHLWEGRLVLGNDTLYVDLDDDGDDDVIASLGFEATMAPEVYQWVTTGWFAWINDGTGLSQLSYPVEGAGDCSDAAPVITAAPDGGIRIEQLLLPMDATCAEGATQESTRSVVIAYDDHGQPWPVQTEPVAAWGGDCPVVTAFADGEVDLAVAPDVEQRAAADVTPLAVESAPSWLDDAVPGWRVVGFVTDEQRELPPFCGWEPTDVSR